MAKKALLVSFEPTTRIVVEVPKEKMSSKDMIDYIDQNWDKITEVAMNRMKQNIDDYLCWENLVWEEDCECPANESEEISK